MNQMVVKQVEGEAYQSDSKEQLLGNKEDVYKVCPKHIVDQECLDEEESYDLTNEFADEPGADTIPLGEIKQMTGKMAVWKKAMQDEIDSLRSLGVYEQLSKDEVYDKYWANKTPTKNSLSKISGNKETIV